MFLKNSGANVIPKGNRLKQYLPYGVINVVRRADCLESFICQKPALASSLENMVDSLICARIARPMARYASLSTLASSNVVGFGYNNPAHHSVGLSTLVITPMFSILASSYFTLGNNGRATLRGVVIAYGFGS